MRSNINEGCTAKTLHNTLSDCAYLYKNLRFLTVTVCELVEELKKYIQSLIMSFALVLSIFEYFSKATCYNVLHCTNSSFCVVTNLQTVIQDGQTFRLIVRTVCQ